MTVLTTTRAENISGHTTVLLRVDGLSKRYGDQQALANVSFDVHGNEILGLIGPNGAGKTTLLEAIAGLGEVEYSYAGRSAKSRSTSHREVLPILYELAGRPIPTPIAGEEYPGYPLVAEAQVALPWLFAALPLLILFAWWWMSQPPRVPQFLTQDGDSL